MSRRRCCCGEPPDDALICGSCAIPKTNLTLSWTHALSGSGSQPMVYRTDGFFGERWETACFNNIRFRLRCVLGNVRFDLVSTNGGNCSGTESYCSTQGSYPTGLTTISLSCSPFFLQASASAQCPAFSAYSLLTVTV